MLVLIKVISSFIWQFMRVIISFVWQVNIVKLCKENQQKPNTKSIFFKIKQGGTALPVCVNIEKFHKIERFLVAWSKESFEGFKYVHGLQRTWKTESSKGGLIDCRELKHFCVAIIAWLIEWRSQSVQI